MSRNSQIALIHIAKAQLEMDDQTYRAFLRDLTGKTSSGKMTDSQLARVIDGFQKAGFRPAARKPPARAGKRRLATGRLPSKIRALWISLYNLGLVRDPSEAALAAFVKRETGGKQTGIEALQWIRENDAYKVIEALKKWAERDAGVYWGLFDISTETGPPARVHIPARSVVLAQWELMKKYNLLRHDGYLNIHSYAHKVTNKNSFSEYKKEDYVKLQQAFGRRIRKAVEAARHDG